MSREDFEPAGLEKARDTSQQGVVAALEQAQELRQKS